MLVTRAAVIGAIVALLAARWGSQFGFFKDPAKTSPEAVERGGKCTWLSDPDSRIQCVEDLREVSDGLYLGSSFVLADWLAFGDADDVRGDLVLVQPSRIDNAVRTISLEGFAGPVFRPHGIDFSASTSRLYVVNHLSVPVIEIFSVTDAQSFEKLKLTHLQTLHLPSWFQRGMANSVAEGALDGSDIYVTMCLSRPIPPNGLAKPASLSQIFDMMISAAWPVIVNGLGWPLTSIFQGGTGVTRCVVSTGKCEQVAQGLFMANGLAFSPNRKVLHVIDTISTSIHLYLRSDSTGKLSPLAKFALPHIVDNVAVRNTGAESYELLLGTVPNMRHPAGVTVATFSQSHDAMMTKDLVITTGHPPNKIVNIASAARWGDKVIVGGPAMKGVLVC